MKHLLLVLICLMGLNIYAQSTQIEMAPNSHINTEAVFAPNLFELQFSFPCAAFIGEYGVETNGEDIYVTQWLDDSIAKYDQQGNVLDQFVIPGVGRVRDLAYDGQYYYGSPNDFFFYVLDMENKSLINTVSTSFRIRGMAYDPDHNVLWASEHWSPMFYKLDMQGNVLDSWLPTGITMDAISGLAYDNNSVGGPFLWGFSQDSTGAVIVKYDIANQLQTGSMIDVSVLGTDYSVAGGLFIHQMEGRSDITLGGMIQNQLVFALELGYANQLVQTDVHDFVTSFELYPNPVVDQLIIDLEMEGEAMISCKIVNQLGQILHRQQTNVHASARLSLPTGMLEEGMYFVEISNAKGYTLTKKFLKVN